MNGFFMTFPTFPIRSFPKPVPLPRPMVPIFKAMNTKQQKASAPQQETDDCKPVFIPTLSTSHEKMVSLPKQPVTPWLNDGQVFALGVLSGSAIQLAWQWVKENKPALFNAITTKAEQEKQLLAIYEKHPEKAKAAISSFTEQISWKIHEKAMIHCGLPPIPLAEIKQSATEGKVDEFIANRIARLLIALDDSMTAQQVNNVVKQYQVKEKALLTNYNKQLQYAVEKTRAANLQNALKAEGFTPLAPEVLSQPEQVTLAIKNRILEKLGLPPVTSNDDFEALSTHIKNSVDDVLKAIGRQELALQSEACWKVLLTATIDIDGDTLQFLDTDQGKALLADWL